MFKRYRGNFRTPNVTNSDRSTLVLWLQNAGKAGMSAVEIDEKSERLGHDWSTPWRTLIRAMVMAIQINGRWYWGPENTPDQGGSQVTDCGVQPGEFSGGQGHAK